MIAQCLLPLPLVLHRYRTKLAVVIQYLCMHKFDYDVLFLKFQSPWGVASGAIMGHLVATSVAVLGGAFLAKYISEKLVGH